LSSSECQLYEVRARKDKRVVDLISDALPFGRLQKNVEISSNPLPGRRRHSIFSSHEETKRIRSTISLPKGRIKLDRQDLGPTRRESHGRIDHAAAA